MRGSVLLWVGGLFICALVAAALFYGPKAAELGQVGANFASKQACSCVFLSGRDVNSCKADFPPDYVSVLSLDVQKDRVRATMLGVFSAEAQYEEGFGCKQI